MSERAIPDEWVEVAAKAIHATREFLAGAAFGIPEDSHEVASQGMARAALAAVVPLIEAVIPGE